MFIRWIPALPMNKIYTEEEVYDLLFTTEQAELIRRLLLEANNKKIAKQNESAIKKTAKVQAKLAKSSKTKTV